MPVSRPGAFKQETSQQSFIAKQILLPEERCRYPHHALRLPGTRWKNTTGARSRRAPTSARDRAPTLSQNIRQGSYTCFISRLVTQWDTFPWRCFGIKRRRAVTHVMRCPAPI
ncbi:jg4322 [Pararge aegeria aegeria]|uniref:Jg4322 protein n=1 Tax=Pararge aegeria aegeria TaxID=348720 RepID=A0A8S4QPV0_9NEOP|nr:jg4322 [Pararge aegeria aegeria]